MEEDIKILENYIYNKKETMKEQLVPAIENLIKRCRELEEENTEIKLKNNAIKRESEAYAKEMINLHNELKLEKEKSKYEWIRQNCLPQNLIDKLYLPKSKIQEKIEELSKRNKARFNKS